MLLAISPATAAFAQSASVLSPINAGSVSSPAASHLISYDGDSGDVYARLASGHGITLRVERISAACASGRQGGTAVRVRAYLDGATIALLVYSHLADVAVSVDQTIGNGTRLGRIATGLPVDGRCWTGPHVYFEARKRGNQPVCVYAINIGGGANVLLGCKTVMIADPNPLGAFDEVTSPGARKLRVRGWTFDPNARTAVGDMHVYVGGEAGQAGVEGHAFRAGAPRPDVDRVHGAGANHGLDATFATGKRGAQRVCVYAINTGPGGNIGLGCKSVTIATPVPAPAPTGALAPSLSGDPEATAMTPPAPTSGATRPQTTAATSLPSALLPQRAKRKRVLRIRIAGLPARVQIAVTWRRGRAVSRARARLANGKIRVRAPRRAGLYTLTLSYQGRRIEQAQVRVR